MKITKRVDNSRAFAHAIRSLVGAGCVQLLALSLAAPTSHAAGIEAVRIATGFTVPLYECAPPGDTARLFVAEQGGLIKIVNLPSGTVNPTPFLDIDYTHEETGICIIGGYVRN